MLLELKEVEQEDLEDCQTYFITIKNHPPLSRAFYAIDGDGRETWNVDHYEFDSYPLTPEDKIYEIPESLKEGQR